MRPDLHPGEIRWSLIYPDRRTPLWGQGRANGALGEVAGLRSEDPDEPRPATKPTRRPANTPAKTIQREYRGAIVRMKP